MDEIKSVRSVRFTLKVRDGTHNDDTVTIVTCSTGMVVMIDDGNSGDRVQLFDYQVEELAGILAKYKCDDSNTEKAEEVNSGSKRCGLCKYFSKKPVVEYGECTAVLPIWAQAGVDNIAWNDSAIITPYDGKSCHAFTLLVPSKDSVVRTLRTCGRCRHYLADSNDDEIGVCTLNSSLVVRDFSCGYWFCTENSSRDEVHV